jgi:HK97 family phage prohead protease
MEKPINNPLISRSFMEYRASQGEQGESIIEGKPIVFDSPTVIAGLFEETISRNAIDPKLLKDVAFFYNHDLNSKPIARTRTGRLKLELREDGVYMRADVNRGRSDVNDLYLAIEDGEIDGMSFMFRVEEDEWTDLDTKMPKRHITKISYVQEISAVNYPAYDSTTLNARSSMELDNAKALLEEVRAKSLDNGEALEEVRQKELELLKLKTLLLNE